MIEEEFISIPAWGHRMGVSKDSAYQAARLDQIRAASPSAGCTGSKGQPLSSAAGWPADISSPRKLAAWRSRPSTMCE